MAAEAIRCGSPPSDPSMIQDLKITLQETSMVFPSQETPKQTMFLSNIDKVVNFDTYTVHFFRANTDFPPQVVAQKLRVALSKALVAYDFLAGRMKLGADLSPSEIDCNGAGAGFVVASSEYSLDDIGDLAYPNPAFQKLVVIYLDNLEPKDHPLLTLQVTSFKCGGFAVGTSNNHATLDGLSFKTFLQNLASLANNKALAIAPCKDRRLLAARSPPIVSFPHPELLKIPKDLETSQLKLLDNVNKDLEYKTFHLTSNDISNLKEKAKGPDTKEDRRITSFNVVTALLWRCKALSSLTGSKNDQERESTVLYAVDIRQTLDPPLPPSYAGNAVLAAYAKAKCKELEKGPFSSMVDMVTEGTKRMTNEYARSIIDWGEINKGFPYGDILISSWWKLGFSNLEYPWGKPLYNCPVVYGRELILLYPDIGGTSNGGVNILVGIPSKEMEPFQDLFHKFLQ